MIGDIVGYVDSRKMSLPEFQQEQLALVTVGWKLSTSAMGHGTPCACGSNHVVYMTYERGDDMRDFNLCLECGSVVEQVPVFEQVEEDELSPTDFATWDEYLNYQPKPKPDSFMLAVEKAKAQRKQFDQGKV